MSHSRPGRGGLFLACPIFAAYGKLWAKGGVFLFDWNATLTGIALVAAIVSPVITTILTNRFQLKLKKLEAVQKKTNVIDEYLKGASLSAYTLGVEEKFEEYRALILLYVSEEHHEKIQQLNRAIENTQFSDQTSALLYDVAQALRAEEEKR